MPPGQYVRQIQPGSLPLDKPYGPLNDFIITEQAAGKLAQLEPWDNTRTLRESIKAMRKYRLGASKIAQYYAEHPEEAENLDVSKQIIYYLAVQVDRPAVKSIAEFVVIYAMLLWDRTPDREKPIQHSKGQLSIVSQDEIYKPLNDLIVELDANELIHTLPNEFIKKEIVIGQTPLTLHQALAVLDENIAGGGKITSHLIDNKMDLGINLEDKEIKNMGLRLSNFVTSNITSFMRTEDLAVLTIGYQSLGDSDESRFGIPRPDVGGTRVPLLRRARFQTYSPLNLLENLINKDRLSHLVSLVNDLKPRERTVMELRIFEGLTLDEVGQAFDGLTCERIRQIEKDALIKMVSKLEKKHPETIKKEKPKADDLWQRLYSGIKTSTHHKSPHGQATGAVPK